MMERVLINSLNIGVFGDSIGKGIVLEKISQRYQVMKFDLNELLGEKNLNLHNFSMMGCTILKGLSIVNRHIRKLSSYRNIFLEFGGNDCDFAWNHISENPDDEHIPKTPIVEFIKLYTQVIDEIRNNGGRPIMLSLPPLDPDRYYNWISNKLNKTNILKWLGSVDTLYRWHEMYNLQSVILAAKLSVPLIDIRSKFLMNHNYKELLCEDGIHPNKAGYELIYKTIAEQYEIGM